MNKKIYVVVITIFSVVLLCIMWQNIDKQESCIIPDDAREICSHNDFIYYIIDENSFSNIVKFDIAKEDTETIYKYKTEGNIDIIELQAIDDYLIWVESPVDYEWEIIKYSLIDNKKSVIRTFEQSNKSFIPTCLSTSNNFLSWYESSYNNKNDLDEILVIYNIRTNKITKKNAYLFGNPYLRAYIRNDYISYITKEKESYYINVYNLITGDVKKIDCISNVAKIMSNGRFTVWMDDYDYRNIYIYDYKNKNYNKINGSLNLFTFVLINNNVYISYSEDNNGFANIYSLDLITSIRKNVTKNSNKNINYYLSKPNINNELLYERIEDGKIKVILED